MKSKKKKEIEDCIAGMTKICGGQPFIKIYLTIEGPQISTNIPEREDVLRVMVLALMHYQSAPERPLAVN